MKNFIYSVIILGGVVAVSSCLYDKGELAQPINGCDTSFYTLQIKPIINHYCAKSGCHVPGNGIVEYTTYAALQQQLPEQTRSRINLPANDPNHMPQDTVLPPDVLAKLNTWIDSGFPGCD